MFDIFLYHLWHKYMFAMIQVAFYPSDDPNVLFERYAGYDKANWCGYDTSNSSTCSPYAPYPVFYFEDIKNDEYDLLFELWEVMMYVIDLLLSHNISVNIYYLFITQSHWKWL